MCIRRTAGGEERQLLLRKTLQREPSPLLDTRAATEQQNSMGNPASLGWPLTALPGLFCSGLEIPVGQKKKKQTRFVSIELKG